MFHLLDSHCGRTLQESGWTPAGTWGNGKVRNEKIIVQRGFNERACLCLQEHTWAYPSPVAGCSRAGDWSDAGETLGWSLTSWLDSDTWWECCTYTVTVTFSKVYLISLLLFSYKKWDTNAATSAKKLALAYNEDVWLFHGEKTRGKLWEKRKMKEKKFLKGSEAAV